MLLWVSLATAGRYDATAPGPGQGGVYLGLSRAHLTTEFWTEGDRERTFVLPASVTTWTATGVADFGVSEHLAVRVEVPAVAALATHENERICSTFGMCDSLYGLGDVGLQARSLLRLRSFDLLGSVEVVSGMGYRHGIDDLAAPGDGNTDLSAGLTVGRSGTLGSTRWSLAAGTRFEWGLGRPPNALDLGGAASLRRGPVEVAAELQRYDSLGGLDFNSATTTAKMADPERFTVIENDFTQVAPRISAYRGSWGLHLSAWTLLVVGSGPEDLRGVGIGLSWWTD